MVSDIALSILSHLEREGCHFNADILESVCEAYQQAAADFVRRYNDVAFFNRIPFAQSGEMEIAMFFHERLKEITSKICQRRPSCAATPLEAANGCRRNT